MPETMEERIARVQARMATACARAGRAADSVRLVAVSKTHPPERVEEAARCGLRLFGENKVQEAAAKIPQCSSSLEWHLVGHLQSNKARVAVQLFSMIHSMDSVDLLQRLNRICDEEGRRMPVCLEVNVAGEGSKFGLAPDAVAGVLAEAQHCARIEVVGLMAIPPAVEDPERARGFFRTLREIRDRLRADTGYELPELSMGMSHDFEIAIEEGSTMVRVGTDIFGARE